MANEHELSDFGKYIKDQLQIRGWKQKQLSDISGISEGNISKLINDTSEKIVLETFIKLSKAFETNLTTLIEIAHPNCIAINDSSAHKDDINPFFMMGNMLGRQEELRRLSEYSDRNQLIFVVGFVGIGKSSLIRSFVRHISEKFESVLLNPEMPIAQIINLLKEDKRYLVVHQVNFARFYGWV